MGTKRFVLTILARSPPAPGPFPLHRGQNKFEYQFEVYSEVSDAIAVYQEQEATTLEITVHWRSPCKSLSGTLF